MNRPTRARSVVALGVAAGLALTGCAGGAAPAVTDDVPEMPAEMTTVRVGIQTSSSMSYLRLGDEQGFFESRNIDIEFVDIATSDVGVTSLVSNQLEFASVNPPVLTTAIDKGLPIRWAVAGVTSPEEVSDSDGIFVKPDSGIQSWADLEGTRVQVPCINCVSDLWVRLVVDGDGGDSDAVEFVVMPSADAPAALEQGTVDGISGFSQLVPVLQGKGYLQIGNQIAETATGQPIIPFGVNTIWADSHPDVARAFIAGAEESAVYADSHIEEWRALLPTFYPQQVPDAAAAAKVQAHWRDCYFEDAVQTLLDGIVTYGWVQNELTVQDLFWDGVEPKFC